MEQAPKIEEQMLKIQMWFGRKTGKLYLNLNSDDQMRDIFLGQLGYTALAKTESGDAQLDKKVLKLWKQRGCEYADNLLKYRDLSKKMGTYVVGLLDSIHIDGRIHTTFNQTGARTGRLSSDSPNLQNQPKYIRSAYVAKPGYVLTAADYSQLEMRILAHFSGDPTLIKSIKEGLDVHSATAAKMFKIPYEDIQGAKDRDDDPNAEALPGDEQLLKYRSAAKTINFGLMYGQGANKLAGTLNIKVTEAREIIKQYFAAFPRVPKYFEHAIAQARTTGYCTTILGRRRLVPGLRSPVSNERAGSERQVKNSPIQGTAAEITKMAMIRIYEDPLITAAGVKMLIQVHDEIVMEVPKEVSLDTEFNDRIKKLMRSPFDFELRVPLNTSGQYGDNWLKAK